jgi:hypothetical protein
MYNLADNNKLMWVKTFELDKGRFNFGNANFSLVSAKSDGIIVNGNYYTESRKLSLFGHEFKFERGDFVAKINLEGKLIWIKDYDNKDNVSYKRFTEFNDGLYSIGIVTSDSWNKSTANIGSYSISAKDKRRSQPFIIKLDKTNGEILWIRDFNCEPNDEIGLSNFKLDFSEDDLSIIFMKSAFIKKMNITSLNSTNKNDKYSIELTNSK